MQFGNISVNPSFRPSPQPYGDLASFGTLIVFAFWRPVGSKKVRLRVIPNRSHCQLVVKEVQNIDFDLCYDCGAMA